MPIPRVQAGDDDRSADRTPGMNQQAPAFPGQGGRPMRCRRPMPARRSEHHAAIACRGSRDGSGIAGPSGPGGHAGADAAGGRAPVRSANRGDRPSGADAAHSQDKPEGPTISPAGNRAPGRAAGGCTHARFKTQGGHPPGSNRPSRCEIGLAVRSRLPGSGAARKIRPARNRYSRGETVVDDTPDGGHAHDQPDHRFFRQQQADRFSDRRRRRRHGVVVHEERPARRHTGSLRDPGDHLLPVGPQPRHPRGSGHLPDRHGHAGRSGGQDRARILRLRLFLRLCHLRGGDRHLLGPFADPGVPVGGSAAAPPGGPDGAGARCHGPGLGVPVRARRYDRTAEPGRAPLLPGLVPALLSQVGAGGGRSGARRRFPPAVPGQSRPQPAAVLQHPRQPGGGGHPGQQ